MQTSDLPRELLGLPVLTVLPPGGARSTLIFRWYDYVAGRWRLATAEIDTLKAKTPYTVKDGKIVEALERGR